MTDNPTQNEYDESDIAAQILEDLDALDPAAGKTWSIEFAKKNGMSEKDIQKYIIGVKTGQAKG